MATLMVPAEDFWKTVPELGVIFRERADEGTDKVTDLAKTFCFEGKQVKVLTKIERHIAAVTNGSLFRLVTWCNLLLKNKPGRRANGRSDKPLALRPRLLCLIPCSW